MKAATPIREFIERRKFNVNLVILPLWLPGLGMVAWGGKYGPWTSVTSIGLGALLAAGAVYLTCIDTIRCPRCGAFIGLTTVSLRRDKPPQPELCVHCGLSFSEPMVRAKG
jgi:hypothetical protein